MDEQQVPAVVLAGGRASAELAEAGGSEHRALAEIHGRPMAAYVVSALRGTRSVGEIVVVGPPECGQLDANRLIPSDAGIVGNVLAGLEACDAPVALIITADIPLVTPEAIEEFVAAGLASGAAFCYGAVPRTAYQRQLPQLKRTWVRLREGVFTGGNLALVRREAVAPARQLLTTAVEARKRPWKLIGLLGWRALVLGVRRLSLRDIEARAAQLLGGPCAILITEHASLGADVDKPADLAAAREILGVRS